ncbi:EF_hand domain-containing protein [Hexamita inflata]|uniref:EF hand domain-containing protein n=1 Tax=Hexamita inflata TaxID=28002 RepID=A0AA86NFR0_9EUKA|nr:EF hand domain-containing protein [Hexamita inflata]
MTDLYNPLLREQYQSIFESANKNAMNQVELDELVKCVKQLNLNFDKQTLDNIFYMFSPACDFKLSQLDFVRFLFLCQATKIADRSLAHLLFICVDEDIDGFISLSEFDHILELLGLSFDIQTKTEMLKNAQKISYKIYTDAIELINKAFNE